MRNKLKLILKTLEIIFLILDVLVFCKAPITIINSSLIDNTIITDNINWDKELDNVVGNNIYNEITIQAEPKKIDLTKH